MIPTERARQLVVDYFNSHVDPTDNVQLTMDDAYVTWFNYTLGNWKELVSTTVPDGKYYEVTYNADAKKTYVDVYIKFDQKTIDGWYL